MSNYKVKFTATKRNDLKALWVTMPDGQEWNIWDLPPKDCKPEVIEAIHSAFFLGMKAKAMQVQGVL